MIGIIRFWNATKDRAVVGTSGYDATFIEKANEAQNQLFNTIMPHWEKNQAVKDMVNIFVKTIIKDTIITTGLLTKEDNYAHLIDVISAGGQPAFPINHNEVAIINTSPIRMPDVSKGLIYYYQKENQIYFLPKSVSIQVEYTYMKRPDPVALTLTPTSSTDLDYLVPSAPTNFEWPEEAFDLLLYMTLEKLGMEMKEPILIEYAKLGINSEMINVDPQ